MQSKVSGALKALTMLRNVPLYHLPSYQIHGSWKSKPSTVFGMLWTLIIPHSSKPVKKQKNENPNLPGVYLGFSYRLHSPKSRG